MCVSGYDSMSVCVCVYDRLSVCVRVCLCSYDGMSVWSVAHRGVWSSGIGQRSLEPKPSTTGESRLAEPLLRRSLLS